MPKRGKLLTPFEMGKIAGLQHCVKSVSKIVEALARSYNCVANYIKREGPYKHGGGYPEKLNERAKRQIIRALTVRDPPSLSKLISELKLEVSKETVRKFIQNDGYKYINCLKAPALTASHKSKRLDWAKRTLNDITGGELDIKKITFSDEKRFLLDGPDCTRYYWAKDTTERKIYGKKVFTKGVMIWAGIGYNGSTSLFICEQSVDSEYYQKILSDCYFPYHQSDYILMQDNATPHVSASTKLFLERHGIRILEWPACSPDCNPIENLWGIIVRRVYEGGKCYQTVEELEKAILAVWDNIRIEEIQKLVLSFPKRLVEVIASQGAALTSY